MIKKTITFDDLDGNQLTEDFYFNLSKAELATMALSEEGGLDVKLMKLVEEKDGGKIIEAFNEILGASYGVRSPDGKRFMKSEDIRASFMETDAYSVLFVELLSSEDAGASFIKGIIPEDMRPDGTTLNRAERRAQPKKSKDELAAAQAALSEAYPPAVEPDVDFAKMTKAQLVAHVQAMGQPGL